MAENATFKIKIQGDTASFENSLKGINTGLKALRGEATNLRKAIKLDPSDMGSTKALQKNLQQQLELSTNKAKDLKKQIAALGEINPSNQNKFLGLQKQLDNTVLGAKKLETELGDVQTALNNGTWDVKGKVDLGDSEQKVNSLKGRFSVLKEVAVGALRQIGATAVSALGNGLKGWVSDAMATQKSMIALKNTMKFKGNAQDFDTVSKSMQKLATDTNANTEDTVKLATTFIGLGDNAGKAVKKTEALVKANQAFGGSGENLKGVVLAYGQMSAAGKVSAENIGQLTDNNTALGASLKDTIMKMNPTLAQYGSFNEAVTKGAVSMDMLDQAMQKMAEGSGGGVTTISDAWDSFNETMSTALLPTLNALTPIITGLIDKMSEWGESAGKTLTNVIEYLQKLFQTMQENGTTLAFLEAWDSVKSIFSSVVSIVGNVIKSLLGINGETAKNATSFENVSKTIAVFAGKLSVVTKNIADFMKKLSENQAAIDVLKTAIVGLGAAFAGIKIANGVIAGIKAFQSLVTTIKAVKAATTAAGGAMKALSAAMSMGVWGVVIAAIAAVVAALVYFFTQTETGRKIWGDFVEFIKTAWQSVLDFFSGLGQWFVDLWTGIVEGSKAIWQGLVDWFTGIITGIQEAWNGMIEFFTGLWNAIANVITTVWNAITAFIGTVVESIMNFFRPLIEFYQSLWNLIFSIINLVLQLVLAAVRAVVMGIQNFFRTMGEVINNVWQAILDFFNPIINVIKNTVQAVTSAIGSFFSSAWDVVSSVWGVVASWFSSKFDAVKNAVSNVFNAFGNFARGAWDAVTGVFSAVGSWFSDKFDSIKSVVSDVFNAFGGFAQGAWDAITDVFGGLVDWFSNIFGGIKDVVDNVLGGISGALDGISGVINGVSKTVGGMFKGSMVQAIGEVSLNRGAVSGIDKNSISNSDNRTYNTFTINAGNQDVTTLARAVKREIDLGRAGR